MHHPIPEPGSAASPHPFAPIRWSISATASNEPLIRIGDDTRPEVPACALTVEGEPEILLSLDQLRALRDAACAVLGSPQTSARDSGTLDASAGEWPQVSHLACAPGLHGSIGATREARHGRWYSPCRKLDGITWWAVGPAGGWLVFPSFPALTEWASSRRGREWALWGRP